MFSPAKYVLIFPWLTPFSCVLSPSLSLLILSIYFSVSVSASVSVSPSLDGEFRPRDIVKGICLLFSLAIHAYVSGRRDA